ncbi:SDR family NAD(P)-dependent oxidoreductase [Azospirillum sp. ST 5-10]|uniref:SDR family NAD(P)-dependent oxidoreductase n=1 Tax=unclassified Azospirillum TaxID=2630922 RepID=UPI003F4A491D
MTDLLRDLFALDGRVALVTGASSGIGRRMALTLARAGAAVVALARDSAALADTVAAIERHGGRAAPLPADLAAPDDAGILAEAAGRPFGPPAILVNAAGVNRREPADAVTPESWDATLRLNLTVPFFLARALVGGMREAGYGRIVNVASLQSFRAFPDSIAYGASKGGIAQLTRAMAQAWSADGITANAIAPGFFPTRLTAPVFADADTAARHARATAIGRNGVLEDLDGATVFLAAPGSAYVTGQVLAVDGGYLAT